MRFQSLLKAACLTAALTPAALGVSSAWAVALGAVHAPASPPPPKAVQAKPAPVPSAAAKPVVATPSLSRPAAKPEIMASPAPVSPPERPAQLASINSAQAFCDQAVKRMPNVTMSLCARDLLSSNGGKSVWGRPFYQRDVISPNAQLKVLVIGGIHGDELSSSALVLHWIQQASQTPSNVHWRFIPLINPDGLLLDNPTRTNAHGVDLNRNFPTPNWDKEAPYYWKDRTKNDPRRYPGVKPLSEPESRWIHDEMARWKPNLIVSVHAPYGVLDFDGPTVAPQRLGRLYLDQVGIFPGSLGNFGGVHKRVPVVTIELPSAIRTPQEPEIRQMWLDLLRWMGERLGAG
jgi:protein MpaA